MQELASVVPSDGDCEVREDMSLQTQHGNIKHAEQEIRGIDHGIHLRPPAPPPASIKPAMYELVKLAELERINKNISDGADPADDGMKLSIVFIRSMSIIHLRWRFWSSTEGRKTIVKTQ